MDANQKVEDVRADLEAGQGCDAARLIHSLAPAERLAILRQAVAANHDDPSVKRVLDFTQPDITAPLSPDAKLVWLTVRDKVQNGDNAHAKKPATLIGFNDLTIMPCKNNSSPIF